MEYLIVTVLVIIAALFICSVIWKTIKTGRCDSCSSCHDGSCNDNKSDTKSESQNNLDSQSKNK